MKTNQLFKISTLLLFSTSFLLSNKLHSQEPTFEWAKKMGGDLGLFWDKTAVDLEGNLFTIGIFSDTIDFDPSENVFNLSAIGEFDIFITKLNTDGNFIWTKQFGGDDLVTYPQIDIDTEGNIYFSGGLFGIVDFDPSAETYNLSSAIGAAFVCKLSNDGNLIWVTKVFESQIYFVNSINVDNDGNVYTTGCFADTTDFDPGDGVYNMFPSGGMVDIYISKLNSDGLFVWAKKMGGNSNEEGMSIYVDPLFNVYSTGYFSGTSDFDPSENIYEFTEVYNGMYISKLDGEGSFVWAKVINGTDQIASIKTDGYGSVYIQGNFSDTTDFDPSENTYSLIPIGTETFLLKLDVNGNFLWVKKVARNLYSLGGPIHIDVFDAVYLTGGYIETYDFDPGESIYNLSSIGSNDIYITKLDVDGNLLWAKSIGGPGADEGISLQGDLLGNIYLTGNFNGIVNFNPSGEPFNLDSPQNSSTFTLKLSQPGFVGIKENDDKNLIIVYPNPSSGLFTIDLKEKTKIIVTNILGETVLQQNFGAGRQIINLQGEANGIYFARININEAQILKLIKNEN